MILKDIFDAYIAFITAELTDYARIPNGLDSANASALFKRKGFAIVPADQTNTNRLIGCRASFSRTYTIALFNKLTATENNTAATDAILISLMQDALKLQLAVEKSTILNQINASVGKTVYTDDSGIFFVTGEREKFLQLDINFETEYFINL